MFIFYIAATHELKIAIMIYQKVINLYETKQKKIIKVGDIMLTAIESWKKEGIEEGKKEEKNSYVS